MSEEESPLLLIYWLLANAGMMVPPTSKYPKLFRLYCYTHVTLLILFITTNTYYIAVNDYGMEEKLGVSQHTLSCVHIAARHINVLLRPKEIHEYFEEIENMWKYAMKSNRNIIIFKDALKRSYKSALVLVLMFLGLIPLIIITCIHNNLKSTSSEWILPMTTWTIFDPKSHYWLASLYQLVTFYSLLLSVGTSKSFQRILFLQICSQFKVLQQMLKERNHKKTDFTHKDIYILHQKTLRLLSLTNYLFGTACMFEMALSSLQIAIRLYASYLALVTRNPMLLHSLLNLILTFIGPYMISWDGNILNVEAEKFFNSAYDNEWYEEKSKTNKELVLLQTMATKPVNVHYKLIFTFSHAQFTMLMQATYSYLMMIKYFIDKD